VQTEPLGYAIVSCCNPPGGHLHTAGCYRAFYFRNMLSFLTVDEPLLWKEFGAWKPSECAKAFLQSAQSFLEYSERIYGRSNS
jgi:hypothetical protein